MRVHHVVTTILLALCCAEGVDGRHVAQRRQDTTAAATIISSFTPASTSATASATSSNAATSSTGQSSSATSNSQLSINGANSSQATSTISSTPVSSLATTASSALYSASSLASATARPNRLPIKPTITPAIGMIGVILIVAGGALTLIGIKHHWIHIFLSTAFLTSLAITVLIIYVMNPPVSNAIQGAYMVASVTTGVILGSISLIFKEVTEGLGCLLGGFCVAMWFLVLAPGGLIHSTSGRAIMIAAFCVAAFALAFSRYTRNYGLILCTSFAGAMIVVLGLDCFSGAGLKEFWLYIWNLNDNVFPINTNTYPVTRGIRVEIGCTVFFFVLGGISQIKLWKIVKERRARKITERMRDDESRDQLESAMGKVVEANTERDRAHWEALYGEKAGAQVTVDSGLGSSIDTFPKRSTSIREPEVDGIEMADIPGNSSKCVSRQEPTPAVTVRVASENDETRLPVAPEEGLLDHSKELSRSGSHRSVRVEDNRTSTQSHDPVSLTDRSERSSVQEGPSIIPLPFLPPVVDEQDGAVSEHRSVASEGTAGQSVNIRRGLASKYLSLKKGPVQQEDDRLVMQHIEGERASSVAATADDDVDVDGRSTPRLSAAPSPYQLNFDQHEFTPASGGSRDRSRSPSSHVTCEEPVEENDDEALVRPYTRHDHANDEKLSLQNRKTRGTVENSGRRSVARIRSAVAEGSDDEDGKVSVVGGFLDHLPQQLSKVVMTYRTNEWAKHITDAEEPNPEEAPESGSNSPGIRVDNAFAEEASKPVDTRALKEVAAAGESAEVLLDASQLSSKDPYRKESVVRPRSSRTPSGGTATPIYAVPPSGMQMSAHRRSSSAIQSKPATQDLRTPTGPLTNQALAESPMEDALADSPWPLRIASPNNLMEHRNNILMHRPRTTSFQALASMPNLNLIATSDSASIRGVRLDEPDSDNMSLSERKQLIDKENMTLAQRKALVQQQQAAHQQREQMQSPTFRERFSASRQVSWPQPTRMNSVSNPSLIYDSHQPQRNSTVDIVKQSAKLTQWRQSLQNDATVTQPLFVHDSAQQAMLHERRQVEWQQQREHAERVKRESVMERAMRTGQMHEAHRDAMRRMQAQANRNYQA